VDGRFPGRCSRKFRSTLRGIIFHDASVLTEAPVRAFFHKLSGGVKMSKDTGSSPDSGWPPIRFPIFILHAEGKKW
jgi:hypothetical protein